MSADDTPGGKGGGPGGDLARELLGRARQEARRRGVARPSRRGAPPRPDDPERSTGPYSGAHPDDRDPQPVGGEVSRIVDERGWDTSVRVASVEARWAELVGADLAAHCRPERVGDGELVVVAESTAWATQVRLLSGQLLARINDQLGEGLVTSLVVRGPTTPSWRSGRLRVSGGRGPRDTYG